MLVAVAEVVLAKLAASVAERLEQFGDSRLILGDALRRARHADGQKPCAERRLAKDKGGAACGARLLGIHVGEKRTLIGDPGDVWRLVAHHPAAVGTDVPETNVVAPDDDDIGLFLLPLCRRLSYRRYGNAHDYC